MASIHKKFNSPFWMAKFRASDGRVVMRSTKQTKQQPAREIANQWERDARKLRNGEFVEAVYLKNLNELCERIGLDTVATFSTEDFFTNWLGAKKTRGSAIGTVSRYKPIVEGFLESLGPRRRAKIGTITPAQVERFRDSELESGKSATTANLSLKIVRGVFNTARRQGLIVSNPAEKIEVLNAAGEQRKPFSPNDVEALLSIADREWQGMILLGYYCGMRLGDAAKISWANIDLTSQTLSYRPQKTAGRLISRNTGTRVYLHDELNDYLTQLAGSDDPKAPLFPSLQAKKSGSHGGLSMTFNSLMQKAGVRREAGAQKTGKGRTFNALGFHSLRHSFISNLANHDVPSDVRKEIAGHSTDEVHRRYVHLSLETQRRAINRIPPVRR